MAGAVAGANIRLGANITALLSGMRAAKAAVSDFSYSVNNTLIRAYKQADVQTRTFRGGLTRLSGDLDKIAGKLALFGATPVLLGGYKAFKDYAEIERLDRGLQRFGATLEEVRELAKLPNVGVFDGSKILIGLRAAGASAEQATGLIKTFANALAEAGGNAADLQPVLENIRQFLSGKITEVDIKQLSQRIPQIRKALKDAFGTDDAEALNRIGAQKVVNGLIVELGKIPPVAGGATSAMDQLGDSFTFASATAGKALDATFGITDAIKGLGETLDDLSSYFGNLAPKTQKAVVSLAAIAVIVPTLITAVSGLIKLLPLLATGFGTLTLPITATIAAVALAAAVIITNWEDVKKFLSETTWLTNLTIGLKSLLGVVVETFKLAVNIITGDWGQAWVNIKNIAKNAANFIVAQISSLAKGAIQLIGLLNKPFGSQAVQSGLDQSLKWVDDLTKKFQFDVPDALALTSGAIDKVKKKFDDITDGGGGGGGADGLADLTEKTYKFSKAYNDLLAAEKDKLDEILRVRKEISEIVGDKGVDTTVSRFAAGSSFLSGEDSAAFQSALATQKAKEATKGIKIEEAPEKEVKKITGAYADAILKASEMTKQLSQDLSRSVQGAATDIGVSFGEMFGNLISGVQGIESFGKRVLASVGGLAKELGKSLIAFGTAGIALKSFVKNPYAALAAGIALVALGQVVQNTANKTANEYSPRFAKGGFAYGEMNAIVGDNPNARFDPEMIAPYSKVDQSIKKSIAESGMSGGGYETIEIKMRGTDLFAVLQRTQKRNNALK